MTPERRLHIEHIFHDALEHDPGERQSFLSERCQGDADLRREVVSMLDADDPQGGMAGRCIRRYQIVRELGRCGMGAVYEAVRTERQILTARRHYGRRSGRRAWPDSAKRSFWQTSSPRVIR